MSTAEKIFETARTLPKPAQNALLQMAELLAAKEPLDQRKLKPRFAVLSAKELEAKIGEGLDDLKSGNVLSSKAFVSEIRAFRAKKRRIHG